MIRAAVISCMLACAVPSAVSALCFGFGAAHELCETDTFRLDATGDDFILHRSTDDDRLLEVFWTGDLPVADLETDLEAAFYTLWAPLETRLQERGTLRYGFEGTLSLNGKPVRYVMFDIDDEETGQTAQWTMDLARINESYVIVEAVRTRSRRSLDNVHASVLDVLARVSPMSDSGAERWSLTSQWEGVPQ